MSKITIVIKPYKLGLFLNDVYLELITHPHHMCEMFNNLDSLDVIDEQPPQQIIKWKK